MQCISLNTSALGVLIGACTLMSMTNSCMCSGASAWNAHFPVPVDTEDLDFTVSAAADPRALLAAAVVHACQHAAVHHRLAVVAAISDATKCTPRQAVDGRPNEALAAAVAAAETRSIAAATASADGGDYSATLQLVPSDLGWRVKIGHRALIDVCAAAPPPLPPVLPSPTDGQDNGAGDFSGVDRDDTGPIVTPVSTSGPSFRAAALLAPRLVPVAAVLPTKCLYQFGSPDHNPLVDVASPAVLLGQLAVSLRSRCAWRIQKDLARLHLVAHAAQMAGDCQTLRRCAGLLGEYEQD